MPICCLQQFYSFPYLKMTAKRIWTAQEDNFLRTCSELAKQKEWVQISNKFNSVFKSEPRSAKQCRERYINYVSNISVGVYSVEWSESQVDQLFELYLKHGPRWSIISQLLANKSENVVKNKFNCSLRKFVRKLNKHMKSSIHKYKKKIRFESAVRAMDAFECFNQLSPVAKQWSLNIRQKLIISTLTNTKNKTVQIPELQWLAQNIKKFCLQTRSYKTRKLRFVKNSGSEQSQVSLTLQQNLQQPSFLCDQAQNSRISDRQYRRQRQDGQGNIFIQNCEFLEDDRLKQQTKKMSTFQSILEVDNLQQLEQIDHKVILHKKETENLGNADGMIDILFGEIEPLGLNDFWM